MTQYFKNIDHHKVFLFKNVHMQKKNFILKYL